VASARTQDVRMDEMEQLYQRHAEPGGSGLGLRIGAAAFIVWTALLFLWALSEQNAYRECVANDGLICFSLAAPILMFWALVSAIGWGTAGLVAIVLGGRRDG
jgi:hypothetical protein